MADLGQQGQYDELDGGTFGMWIDLREAGWVNSHRAAP
jgi:hypothetical protein